ncbi:MAG: Foldase protein PrsA [Parcubacteria group bacterium GW2011_GWC2_39_14]|nr:MAG: Foldase protein PrsA [Parcubacteria group bacterium GW2011_GWC2_39_14]KKR55188.1 MAG: Foldase protein PrsA [Parcubacteria group bacterium GW2011_GWA2_40_23]
MDQEVNQEVHHSSKKRVCTKTKKIIGIVVCVLIVVICFFGVVGLGAYKLNWNGAFAQKVLTVLPYPAAIVNGHIIKYSDWKYETTGVIVLNQKKGSDYTAEAVGKEVLQKMIYDQLMEKIAKKYDIKVTDEDMQAAKDSLITQVGKIEDLEKNVRDYFNWDVDTFMKRVIYSDVLRNKLETEIPKSADLNKDAEKKANDVLKEVQKGEKTFAELAQVYSEDPGSATQGGDLGWFARGAMVKEFEDATFALEKGAVSGLVRTEFGYHIIKLEDKKTEAVAGAKDPVEQVLASHILIKTKSFADLLTEIEKSAKIKKFVALGE